MERIVNKGVIRAVPFDKVNVVFFYNKNLISETAKLFCALFIHTVCTLYARLSLHASFLHCNFVLDERANVSIPFSSGLLPTLCDNSPPCLVQT
jgi:hypothetical protein